jgi:hypothetical protein
LEFDGAHRQRERLVDQLTRHRLVRQEHPDRTTLVDGLLEIVSIQWRGPARRRNAAHD